MLKLTSDGRFSSLRVAVPTLLGLALVLTVVLALSLERWYSTVAEALLMGGQPPRISSSDLEVRSAVLNLPPGFVVEGIFPAQLSIRLVRQHAAALRLGSEVLAKLSLNPRENSPVAAIKPSRLTRVQYR